jgi:CRP-like cAMP-binding protein
VARAPGQRLAAFLSAIARNNAYEGRDPRVIPETLTAGFVADLLRIDVEELAGELAGLRSQGLVDQTSSKGLVLLDPVAVERLAQ